MSPERREAHFKALLRWVLSDSWCAREVVSGSFFSSPTHRDIMAESLEMGVTEEEWAEFRNRLRAEALL